MKLVGYLEKYGPEVIRDLQNSGIVKTRRTESGLWFLVTRDRQVRELPESAKNTSLFVEEAERGGGLTSDFGTATIVCDHYGEPLPALRILVCPVPYLKHAYFRAASLVTVSVEHKKGNETFTITEHEAKKDGRSAKILSRKIWQGTLEEFPADLIFFGRAVRAAERKAYCRGCRGVHYGFGKAPDLALVAENR